MHDLLGDLEGFVARASLVPRYYFLTEKVTIDLFFELSCHDFIEANHTAAVEMSCD